MPNRLQSARTRTDIRDNRKQYFKYLKYPVIPPSVDDVYITTSVGDRLDLLADTFYNDVDLWWIIATANPDVIRRDSYNLKPGLEIRIPLNTEEILREYENLNK